MRKVISVPYIDQTEKWPTGCESVSSVMLLQYLGVDLSVDEFISGCLPMKPMGHIAGRLCGPDPNCCFAGSPYDPDSFGCYPGVIIQALDKALADRGLTITACDATGIPTDDLLKGYIDRDLPVIYWATIDLMEAVTGPDWLITDQTPAPCAAAGVPSVHRDANCETLPDTEKDRVFTWVSNEHCMLLVGYDTDRDTLVFNDPWHNHGVIDYDRTLVLQRHREQAERAVVLRTGK